MRPIAVSETTLCHILFECTQKQTQVIRDFPFRQLTKQTFRRWIAEGKRLWKYQSKIADNVQDFDALSEYVYLGVRELMAAEDKEMALAMLIAFNEGHVKPVEDGRTEE